MEVKLSSHLAPEAEAAVGVDTLMQRMKTLSERREEFSAEERAERFARVELQSVELGASATPRVRCVFIYVFIFSFGALNRSLTFTKKGFKIKMSLF